jgi:ribosomal protein S18 acetylase RimI-like enzyme
MTIIGDVRLRRAAAVDAGAVRAVTLAAYAKWVPIIGQKPQPMLANYTTAVETHLIDVLEAAGQIIALIELVPEAGCLLIENVAVHPDHARRGYGRRLIVHAEQLARDMRFDQLRLYTNRLMTSNIALYQRIGFVVAGEEAKLDGRVVVHMTKPLK